MRTNMLNYIRFIIECYRGLDMKEVIKFAKFYYELGYSLNEAITMAINIAREVEMSKYE